MVEAATEIEGHPDNVAPVIYGGMVSGFTTVKQVRPLFHL